MKYVCYIGGTADPVFNLGLKWQVPSSGKLCRQVGLRGNVTVRIFQGPLAGVAKEFINHVDSIDGRVKDPSSIASKRFVGREMRKYNIKVVEDSTRIVDSIIKDLRQSPFESVLLLGFSRGACLALHIARRLNELNSQLPVSIVAIDPMFGVSDVLFSNFFKSTYIISNNIKAMLWLKSGSNDFRGFAKEVSIYVNAHFNNDQHMQFILPRCNHGDMPAYFPVVRVVKRFLDRFMNNQRHEVSELQRLILKPGIGFIDEQDETDRLKKDSMDLPNTLTRKLIQIQRHWYYPSIGKMLDRLSPTAHLTSSQSGVDYYLKRVCLLALETGNISKNDQTKTVQILLRYLNAPAFHPLKYIILVGLNRVIDFQWWTYMLSYKDLKDYINIDPTKRIHSGRQRSIPRSC